MCSAGRITLVLCIFGVTRIFFTHAWALPNGRQTDLMGRTPSATGHGGCRETKNRKIYIFNPEWKGAWRFSKSNELVSLASAGNGRSMPLSKGRSFDPVDIEIGPDNAIWISSWGRQYGAHYENGKLANEGRIYRIWPKKINPKNNTHSKRSISLEEWSLQDLLIDLGSH